MGNKTRRLYRIHVVTRLVDTAVAVYTSQTFITPLNQMNYYMGLVLCFSIVHFNIRHTPRCLK